MSRYSNYGTSTDNKESYEVITRDVDGKKLMRAQDTTTRTNWEASRMMSRDGYPLNAQANYTLGGEDGETYPGKGVKGLDNATPGSMIVYQEPVGDELTNPDGEQNKYKRPWIAAFVESKNPTTGCLTVATMNNPDPFSDSCGSGANVGVETRREICPSSGGGKSLFSYPGGKMPDCSTDFESYACQDPDWAKWTVHNPYKDAAMLGFNPTTGEAVKTDCSKYWKQIQKLTDQGLAEPKAPSMASQILKIQDQAVQEGCQPNPENAKRAGMDNPSIAASYEKPQYVPASAGESGIPMNFDFIGMISGLIGQLTGGGNIFPAIKDTATKYVSGQTGGGSTADTQPSRASQEAE